MLSPGLTLLSTVAKPALKRSGLQQQVLALYRDCLRKAKQKNSVDARRRFQEYVRHEFRKTMTSPELGGIDRRDFAAIEFLVRKGRRQLEQYGGPSIGMG